MAFFWGCCLTLGLNLIPLSVASSETSPKSSVWSVSVTQAQLSQTEGENASEISAPETTYPNGDRVVLGDKTLFLIGSPAGPMNRSERAAKISEDIQNFARDRSRTLDSLNLKEFPDGQTVEIRAEDTPLMSIYKADAQAAGEDQSVLAQLYLDKISQGVAGYRELYSPRSMLIGFVKAGAATLGLLSLILVINRLFWFGCNWFNTKASHRIRTIQIGRREIVNAAQINKSLLLISKLFRYFLFFILASIYLKTVLTFFPQTRLAAQGIFRPVTSTIGQILQGVIGYIPKLIFLVFLVIITLYILKIIRFVFEEIEQGEISVPGFDQEWAVPTSRIIQILTFALAGVIAFPYLPGANSDAFQGISIFLGILISLGSSSAIANLIAGILLTYTRAFRIGDEVEIGGVGGTVIEKGMLVIRILTWEHCYVSIPNSEVLSSHVTNFRKGGQKIGESSPPPIILMQFGFSYDVPWQKVYDILLKAAQSSEHVMTDPASYVLHEKHEESCAIYSLRIYTNEPEKDWWIKSHVLKHVQDACIAESINLVVPNFFVAATTPKHYSDPL